MATSASASGKVGWGDRLQRVIVMVHPLWLEHSLFLMLIIGHHTAGDLTAKHTLMKTWRRRPDTACPSASRRRARRQKDEDARWQRVRLSPAVSCYGLVAWAVACCVDEFPRGRVLLLACYTKAHLATLSATILLPLWHCL